MPTFVHLIIKNVFGHYGMPGVVFFSFHNRIVLYYKIRKINELYKH